MHTHVHAHPSWGGGLRKRACPHYTIPLSLKVQPNLGRQQFLSATLMCLNEKLVIRGSRLRLGGTALSFKEGKRWLPLEGLLFHGARQRALSLPRVAALLPSPLPGHAPWARPAVCSPDAASAGLPGGHPRAHEAPPAQLTQPGPGTPCTQGDRTKGLIKTARRCPPHGDAEISGLPHQEFLTGRHRMAAHRLHVATYTSFPLPHLLMTSVGGAGAQPRNKGRCPPIYLSCASGQRGGRAGTWQ